MPQKARIDWESGSEVRGPLAMMTMPSAGISGNFLPNQFDVGVIGYRFGHVCGKPGAIDGKSAARGHANPVGDLNENRALPPQFFFQEPRCVVGLVGFQRVAADDFGKMFAAMCRSLPHRPHFIQAYRQTVARNLPGGFGSCQAAADDCNGVMHSKSRMKDKDTETQGARRSNSIREELQRLRDECLQVFAMNDGVDHSVFQQKLAALKPFGKLLPDRLLDHARPGEADQRAGFRDD